MEESEHWCTLQYYLLQHMSTSNVFVSLSQIPNAGLGLYTSRPYIEGDTIGQYQGVPLTTKAAMHLVEKEYLIRIGPQCYLNAKDMYHCFFRYMNDVRVTRDYNASFYKDMKRKQVNVIATRDLKANEEIYVDYGKWYWIAYNLAHPLHPILKTKYLR